MTSIGPDLLARLSALGFVSGVGVLYGLTLEFLTNRYRRQLIFEDDATRREKVRVWAMFVRNEYNPGRVEFVKYTLGWGAAGALLFALGTLLVAGIGAVFL